MHRGHSCVCLPWSGQGRGRDEGKRGGHFHSRSFQQATPSLHPKRKKERYGVINVCTCTCMLISLFSQSTTCTIIGLVECLIYFLSDTIGARSTQEEVVQCTVPPKQVCHGLSGRKVDYTIHVSCVDISTICNIHEGSCMYMYNVMYMYIAHAFLCHCRPFQRSFPSSRCVLR